MCEDENYKEIICIPKNADLYAVKNQENTITSDTNEEYKTDIKENNLDIAIITDKTHIGLNESIEITDNQKVIQHAKSLPHLVPYIPYFENYKKFDVDYIAENIINADQSYHSSFSLLMNEQFIEYMAQADRFADIIKIFYHSQIPSSNLLIKIFNFVIENAFPRHESKITIDLIIQTLKYLIHRDILEQEMVNDIMLNYDSFPFSEKVGIQQFFIDNIYNIQQLIIYFDWSLIFCNFIDEYEAREFLLSKIDIFDKSEDWLIEMSESYERIFENPINLEEFYTN